MERRRRQADVNRIVRRRIKVRRRPYYYRNHQVKRANPAVPNQRAGFRGRKRRYHTRVHPGWKKVTKVHRVSADLQAVIGVPRASRGQIVSLIWTYIRTHNLKNQVNGRLFVPDETLARVVGNEGQEMDGFRMMAPINQHIIRD